MLEHKIKEIILDTMSIDKPIEKVNSKMRLFDMGIDSIRFIKIIVAIEDAFGFEFEDEDMDNNKFETIESLVSYVKINT